MQRAMDMLSAFVERRRAVVIAVWLAAIVAAVPLSLAQTDHLRRRRASVLPRRAGAEARRGRRGTPGRERQRRASSRPPAAPRGRASVAHRAPAHARATAASPRRRPPGGPYPDAAVRQPGPGGRRSVDPAPSSPRPGRRAARRRAPPRRPGGAVGRHAGPQQAGPRIGREGRLPDRAHHPARRLRLARRGLAAARARVRERDAHGRGDLGTVSGHRDVGLRHERRLDDRDRRGGRLLAVRPRPLPRGDPVRGHARGGAEDSHEDVRRGRRLLGANGVDLPRRPLPRRFDHDPLDGHRRDRRSGDLDRRRRDDAARAHERVRQARLRARAPGGHRLAAGAVVEDEAAPPRRLRAGCRPSGLLAALGRPRDAPPGARRDRHRWHASHARGPGALAEVRRRCPAPVPEAQRDARGRRARGARHGPGFGRSRRGDRGLQARPGDRHRERTRARAAARPGPP